MKTDLPALISCADPSTWASCRVITPNLERAYRAGLGGDFLSFKMRPKMTDYHVWQLAEQIHQSRPDRLIFLDHRPNPAPLIRALKAVYGSRALPPCQIHVYGDFSLDAAEWLRAEQALKGAPVRFCAASPRAARFVGQMEITGGKSVEVCPFPVDTSTFTLDPDARHRLRKERGVSDSEIVVAYSGRLTLQKNTDRLLSEFARFAEQSKRPVRLWLAGGFDDLGAPFFGIRGRVGGYYQQWSRRLGGLPDDVRHRVEYFGILGSKDLCAFYNAADLFVSLSLHHDEDYGMAPAEALCCGTPSVLTDWGGYASFQLSAPGESPNEHCRLVPVTLDAQGLGFSSSQLTHEMIGATKAAPAAQAEARKARARLYASKLSIEAAAKILRDQQSRAAPSFVGFSWRLRELARIIYNPMPYPEGPRRGTFYEEIYGRYLRSDRLASVSQ